jgi:8-oxo-dGTP pyrophosphatase MutT (NUDIX family)
VWPWPEGVEFHARIADGEARGIQVDLAAAGTVWERMRAENPRLFDGPILSVERIEPGREIVCRPSSYRMLAVQPPTAGGVETGVEQLSVTGAVLGRNEGKQECVLLGRRGRRTRIYGGMWELAPSGGIDPPRGRVSLCEADLIAQLQTELREETGLDAALRVLGVWAVCHDLVAHSYDVVFVCRVPIAWTTAGLEIKPEAWEYEAVRWVPLARLKQFDQENAAEIIPPTRALFRFFGWV